MEAAVWPEAAWAGGVDVGKIVAFCCKSDSASMIWETFRQQWASLMAVVGWVMSGAL